MNNLNKHYQLHDIKIIFLYINHNFLFYTIKNENGYWMYKKNKIIKGVYENGEDIKIANYAEDDNSLFICANH